MKRIVLSTVLVVLLLVSLTTISLGAGVFTITASQETVAPGATEATVSVTLENNPGFATTGFAISYDANVLQYSGFTAGSIFNTNQIEINGNEAGLLIVSIIDATNHTDNGLLFELEIRSLISHHNTHLKFVFHLGFSLIFHVPGVIRIFCSHGVATAFFVNTNPGLVYCLS